MKNIISIGLASTVWLVTETCDVIVQTKEVEPDPLVKKYNPEACTDPYYTVVIDGETYSGSTETAHNSYLEMATLLKKILYDPNLDEDDRWKRVKNIQEIMQKLNRFRGECEKYAKKVYDT